MNNNLLSLSNLSYQIENKKILSDLNLEIPNGKFQIILGANGAGKSTLLKILAGLLSSSSGQINKSEELSIAYLGHQSQLYSDLTVRQNLDFLTGFLEIPVSPEELLARWNLSAQSELRVSSLSQGQVKRLSLAINLATAANLYLLDEPGTNLDHLGKELLLKELASVRQSAEKSFLLITHEPGDYFNLADQILFLGIDGLRVLYTKDVDVFNLSEINQRYLELLRS